jgi:hypothetical protein
MKNIFISVFFCFILSEIYPQADIQSAKGNSTILLKGFALNLDIGKTELNMDLNNLLYSVAAKDKFIYGGKLSAKNEEGIGNLFSQGYLVPSGSATGFLGWSFSNGKPSVIISLLEDKLNKFIKEFDKTFNEKINNSIIENTSDIDLQPFKDTLLFYLNKEGLLSRLDKFLVIDIKDKNNLNDAKKNIKEEIEKLKNKYDRKIAHINKKLKHYSEDYGKSTYYQLMVFGFGGISSMSFKHYTHLDTINFNNSFDNEYFRGGKAGIGINLQYGNFLMGLTYNYTKINNFDLLTKKDYTLTQTQTLGNQTLSNEKKITSYSGEYGKVEINNLNFDLILNFKLDEKATNYILINPYIKSQLFSRDENLLPNKIDIGCGFYFFQQTGTFLGGLYAELPDINNNYEKAKPINEQNFREPFKRLSFGIVGKYSFNSLSDLF